MNRRVAHGTTVALAAAILAVAGGVYIAHFSSTRKTGISDVEEPAKPTHVHSSATREVAPTARTANQVSSTSTPKGVPIGDGIPPQRRIVEMISSTTNSDGSVLERFRTADGKVRSRQSAPKPIFDNASDQLIAMAASGAESGHTMPPIPVMDNADEVFMRSLDKEITIAKDDSDEVKSLKQSVIAIREEMRRLVGEGRSFAEVIKDHRDTVNHRVQMRAAATRMVKEFLDNGDREAAEEVLKKINDALDCMGIPNVEMPPSDEERREQIRKRHGNGN